MRLSIAVLALVTVFTMLQPPALAEKAKSSASQNKMLIRKSYTWMNANNWDSVATVISADFVDHDPDQGQKPGLAGLKEMFAGYDAAFPDMKMDVKEVMAEGDMVIAHVIVTGTNSGPMMGNPPTGKKMEVELYDQFRMKNGKVVERWGVFDSMKMMTQLGMMPPPGAAKEDKK